MKKELVNIGFKEMSDTDFLELDKGDFKIEFSLKGEYFHISTLMTADRESAPYPYKGVDKLKNLIKANEEYFK
jgi:hypothetical protein